MILPGKDLDGTKLEWMYFSYTRVCLN
jgi:hypothetical protein